MLSSREAQRRLAQYGPNPLQRREGVQWPRELALPLTHSLAVLLWVAALSFIVGSITVGVAVVLIIVLNAAVVFVQSATRRTRSRRSVGVFSNRYLLWAIAGELAIAAVFGVRPTVSGAARHRSPTRTRHGAADSVPVHRLGCRRAPQVGDPE